MALGHKPNKIPILRLCFANALTMAFYSRLHALQRLRVARVTILRVESSSSPVGKEAIHDLKRGLSTLGYIEGQNIEFEIRWAENKLDRLPSVSAELVKLHPDVIVTGGPQAVKSLKATTSTIPIVMGRMDDVVEHGLVSSLARPGGNVTGLSFQTGELSAASTVRS